MVDLLVPETADEEPCPFSAQVFFFFFFVYSVLVCDLSQCASEIRVSTMYVTDARR